MRTCPCIVIRADEMTLHGERGGTFRLSIDGYQFPETTDDRWDANWLFVRGHVQDPQGEWTFRDPCLTTFEVQELAEGLGVVRSAPRRTAGELEPSRCAQAAQEDRTAGVGRW